MAVLVGGAAAAYALTQGDGSDDGRTARTAPVSTQPVADEPDPRLRETTSADESPVASGSVSEQEANDLLDAYEEAFGAAETGELADLFAENFERRTGEGAVQDTATALREYGDQFERFPDPTYRLSDRAYKGDTGDGSALITARYRITNDGERVGGGTIRFQIVREDDAPRIAVISIQRD